MKILKKIFIFSLCVSLFVGCASKDKNKSTSNSVTTEDLQLKEEERYEFSHGIKDYNQEKLIFDGKNLNIVYEIENKAADVELGLMIFIDGIIQDFKVNQSTDISLYKFNMSGEEKKDISLQVSPNTGSIKTESMIRFLVVLNPSTQVKSLKDIGNNFSISQPIGSHLVFKKEPSNIRTTPSFKKLTYSLENMTNDEKQIYIKEINNEKVNKLDNQSIFYLAQNNENIIDKYDVNSEIEFKTAGIAGKYNFIVFEDLEVTSCTPVELKRDAYTFIKGFNPSTTAKSLFAILIPLEVNGDNVVTQSSVYVSNIVDK